MPCCLATPHTVPAIAVASGLLTVALCKGKQCKAVGGCPLSQGAVKFVAGAAVGLFATLAIGHICKCVSGKACCKKEDKKE